jgi:hypothetical protein
VSEVLDIVCWKWKPDRPYRSTYNGEAVNVLRNMVARNYSGPHRFSCITDDASGIDQAIRVIPIRDVHKDVSNPSNKSNPSCYRRLWAFSDEARAVIGDRFVSLDLDVVITGNLDTMFNRTEDFVIWGGQALGPGRLGSYNWYNGSLWMLRAGTRTKVWTEFNPATSPQKAHAAGCRGSDQGWIAHCLGPKEARFSEGVYSFRNHVMPNKGRLFKDSKIVIFHGRHDPWNPAVQLQYPWIKEHYR